MPRRKFPAQIVTLVVFWAFANSAFAQMSTAALQQLRAQLVATNGLRDCDVVAVISERALNDTAQRMAGLEIKLANGAVMKINAIAIELKTAAALVKIGVQVNPSSKLKAANFRLWGKLGGGEVHGAKLRLPFQLTDVAFGAEDANGPSLLRFLLREWLLPEKWNAVLPPLEIPLQLNQTFDIPAAKFEAQGELPMTVETPAYQVKLDLTLAALAILDGRAVIALNLQPNHHPMLQAASYTDNEIALTEEIHRLTQHLTTSNDLQVRVRREAINLVLAQIAAARGVDMIVQLKQGRLRAEEIDALLGKIINYTEVESGDGNADVMRLTVEDISATRIFLRLTGQGELNAKVKGREFGVAYNLAPRSRFSLDQALVPFNIISRNDRIVMQAVRGTYVPVKLQFALAVVGHPIQFSHTVKLRAEEWLKDFELPTIFTQEVSLPRKIALGKEQQVKIESSEISRYTVANLRLEGKEDALEINADIVAAKK
jgi:hypothetical protein